ncbi:hypothetical protein ASPVEDRAFT_147979 [Aspergillus versicolor CBS 583.65]|uniref:Uncharacterized protein n=1 Tax=Aspergillus versicolor CBS 583.65 TaxID=1036611 RepID=A0A1L9PBF5_ASPVE|nr:uncharacterized protein ASPVEDRAFT_147979 [Aspergillus versicolor CBS 583.65]OJI98794.1 hypothetical protein ASPVEDRAFT_147979 [Aspergillus versicolor CBS 583.65]
MKVSTAVPLLFLTQALAASSQQPSGPSTTTASVPNPTACGEIVNGGPETLQILNATQAYDCLRSVPFNPAVARQLLQYMNDTIQFQSTLAYLAEPPRGYQQPAVDLLAGLDQIQRGINDGMFTNEHDFENALYRLLTAAHDDHLTATGGILSTFVYGAPWDIVSVSVDGIEPPKVYIADDLLANESHALAWQPSAISVINGQDVVDYLAEFAAQNSIGKLEPHADWNMLMRSGALETQGLLEVFFGGATVYPGDTITLTFENGTVVGPEPWQAIYLSPGDTGPLQTGGDFYNFFVLGLYPASYVSEEDSTGRLEGKATSTTPIRTPLPTPSPSTSVSTTAPSFDAAYPTPEPIFPGREPDDTTLPRVFFLHDSSVAVLSITDFAAYDDSTQEFLRTVKAFLRRSKEAGLKKVVIDVQQNRGGQVFLAIETFKLFFPTIEPFAGSRRRAHRMADVLGDSFTSFWDDLPPNRTQERRFLSTNEWVIQNRLDRETGDEFVSWEDYSRSTAAYGGDNFTRVEQYDQTDSAFIHEASGIDIESLDAFDSPPYAAKDIIILSDGLCSSTCAIFMELMHHEAHVRTIAVGGRPDYTPMQAPAGTRGAASYNVRQMDLDIYNALLINNETSPFLPDRTLDFYLYSASVNLRDQIRRDDPSNTPLQFKYEAADCRIFFTPKTWYNYTNLWNYAAEAAWHNPELCIAKATSNHTRPPPTPYQVETTRPSSPTQQSNQEQDSDQDDYYTNDPANDILAFPGPIRGVDGRRCSEYRKCDAGFVCKMGPVCDKKGRVKYQRQCVARCSSIGGQEKHSSCHRGSCKFDKSSFRQAPRVNRNWGSKTGYCVPPWPLCRPQDEADDKDLDGSSVPNIVTDLTGVVDDDDDDDYEYESGTCMANLPEKYFFDCFFYYGRVQKCYSWGEDKIRYCTNEQLDELEGEWPNFEYDITSDGIRSSWEESPSNLGGYINRHKDDESQWLEAWGYLF